MIEPVASSGGGGSISIVSRMNGAGAGELRYRRVRLLNDKSQYALVEAKVHAALEHPVRVAEIHRTTASTYAGAVRIIQRGSLKCYIVMLMRLSRLQAN